MTYKEPLAALPQASDESHGKFALKLSKEEINLLPIRQWDGKVHLVRSNEESASAIATLRKSKVLGFDTESPPAFRKGVNHLPTLIQLANAEEVFLFQLRRLSNFTPLIELFQNSAIIKAGVALDQDIRQLQAVFPFVPAGFIDLGEEARRRNIASHGLRTMAASMLGFRISKRAQCSNWASAELKEYQIVYAATDAWVSLEIYRFLKRIGVVQ